MKNAFMTSTSRALVELRAAQVRHGRMRSRADAKLDAAKVRHAAEIAAAAGIEADAWQVLLAIPGVSIATASALLDVSQTSVSRWANRTSKPTSRGGLS
ncbi:MAG: hypothetical protein Q7L55_02630 [Actinomycetota bacterium]|nr:hypothetical protein [Actinomycetota bacterium]